ncbi:hypothetical protein [Sphingobacterium haloxyli]|uniref:Uncharacterized protein n=1 Tax=Sphingobacterium haloxyli TaxID=2100533 RepID=A0A2S9J2B5_9SPHI|nr:hypothetical protein [Sphingobacterium haloxyli]PRD46926.1 hypothetical protein C5745_12565 [Sphingobacterium haloxyli]
MKQTFIVIIIVTLVSCRSYREKTLHERGSSTLSEAGTNVRYGFQFTDKDSLDRTWYFATDSVLYFHPEYGLISNGGHLHFLESQIGLQHLQVEVDSLETQRTEINARSELRTSRIWYKNVWVWMLLVGAAGVVGYYVKA